MLCKNHIEKRNFSFLLGRKFFVKSRLFLSFYCNTEKGQYTGWVKKVVRLGSTTHGLSLRDLEEYTNPIDP